MVQRSVYVKQDIDISTYVKMCFFEIILATK